MTPPKVLGVEMRERSAGPYPTWHASFGCVSVSITANCDAEGLLLAIKSAIPDAPTTGGDDGQA